MGIKNNPNQAQLNNLIRLAEKVFEPAREHFNVPIHISSGYRIINLNQAIKGSVTSQHCKGEAIDIDMQSSDVTNAILFHWIKDNLEFDQLIWEFGTKLNPDWIHVSYSDNNRNQVMKALKINGKTVYKYI
jgi:zinc D-Ala-D-Ala carboxypeptidase